MDDDVNRSSESLPTSDEFELIGGNVAPAATDPKLYIAGDASEEQLKETLLQVLEDIEDSDDVMLDTSPAVKSPETNPVTTPDNQSVPTHEIESERLSYVAASLRSYERGDSVDKNMMVYTTSPSPLDEDLMSISISLADGEYTVFDRITYLGSATIPDPKNESDVRKSIAVLNEQSAKALSVSLSLPINSEGHIILYEPSSSNEIASFPILQIVAYVAGESESKDANCLSLVHRCCQGTIPDSTVFQCHVFRCEIPEAVPKIMQCLASAAKKVPKLPLPKSDSYGLEKGSTENTNKDATYATYVFDGSLEIKEDDSKGGYASCPKDKDYFKLRSKLEKSVVLTFQQVSDNKELTIERCFGILISPGRNVKTSDMQLIEMMSFSKPEDGEKGPYVITGLWDPNDPAFEILNTETPKDTRVYMSVAADLVITGIQEPVRILLETKAKIYPPTERFWYFSKKTLCEQYYLRLREINLESTGEVQLQVVGMTSSTRLQNKKASLSLNFLNSASKSTNVPTPSSPEEPSVSDNDEPLLSGTGDVSKDCTETQLEGWSSVLLKWRQNLSQRPKALTTLVRRGIPEALRGEVWQLLAGCHDHKNVVETYQSLINKDSTYESIIQRDIYRTFPAHELFSEKNGTGQESLYRICKAYSIYDPEIGYCQGLSFLVAALLLHMPEEEAFGVLMKIMFEYRTRDMFRNGFEELHLKFYQLKRLMEDHMPGLVSHFDDLGIEVHMFASQWFLTLFTAKFPLITVFFIIDLFLLDGMDVIFQVALALLTLSQRELLALDFEGILKHFRVSLPKKYRTEASSKVLIQSAIKIKVKKLKKYEKEYEAFKNQEKLEEDPIKTLQKENKRLLESNLHLDRENDDLAHDLINIKLQLRNDLVKSEDKCESQAKDLQAAMRTITELEEEKKRLSLEVAQLKELCRREMCRAENETQKHEVIIKEYKEICKQLNTRLDSEKQSVKEVVGLVKKNCGSCKICQGYLNTAFPNFGNIPTENVGNTDNKLHEADAQARELELELARTKLALVEAECKNQDLTHQLNAAVNELATSKNTWLFKTLSTFRDVAKKESPTKENS